MPSKKHKSKAVDKSTGWSTWLWDAPNSRWYRTRYDANGSPLYEYDTRQAATTPRGGTQYTSDTTDAEQIYYANDRYGYQATSEPIDSLSTQFQRSNISFTERPLVDHSPSYDDIPSSSIQPSQASGSVVYGGTRPIDVPVSPARSRFSEHREYSASAPAGGYTDFKDETATSILGLLPEESSGLNPGNQESEQAAYGSYQLAQTTSNVSHASTSTASPPSLAYASFNTAAQQQTKFVDAGSSGGVTPHKIIKGTQGNDETLDPKFKIHHSKHFTPGQVFKVLWSEPGGETQSNATEVTSFTVGTRYGQKVHSTIRRFVIVAADHGHCQCLPILTYHNQGTKKWGVVPDDHAIVYVGDQAPPNLRGENILSKPPIEMIPKSPRHKLEPASRINYAKIYTVEHNVKVCFIGHIAPSSEMQLMRDFDDTWYKKRQMGAGQ